MNINLIQLLLLLSGHIFSTWIGGRDKLGESPAIDIRTKFITTANNITGYDGYTVNSTGHPAPIIQQGDGLVDAVKLINYATIITSNAALELNDTVNRVSTPYYYI